jgi:glycosyltransferase involved in cell wall biosynthesis
MRIFGIMVVKNEADIVGHTLRAACRWCDEIYVLDNGSTDETWDLVQELSRSIPQIIPFEQTDEPFFESIRAKVFNAYKSGASDGDWWCRLDADELYVQSPREFLAEVTRHEVVWAIHLQYYLTKEDVERFESSPALFDSNLPLNVRYHWYKAEHSEPRFFRHRSRLRWDGGAWPRHLGRVFPKRILLRHYKFRSPSQIQTRLRTRMAVFERGGFAGQHWRNKNWKVRDKSELDYDDGSGSFVVDERQLPSHLEPLWKRTIKNFMHASRVWP